MDYYTLRKIVEALRVKIKGNRLKDVREREHIVELVFKKVSLLFSLYPEKLGIYFFDNPFLDEGEKGLFSKNLANYVGGFRLEDICIVEGDRIVEFHFLRSDPLGRAKRLVLVYELLGKFANLILLEDNVIRLVKREVET
ncbi:MAG: NFACT family protein, partial [candidate division WOR-3 bacterium]